MGFVLAVLAFALTLTWCHGLEVLPLFALFVPTSILPMLIALLVARHLTIGERATGAGQIALFGLCFVGLLLAGWGLRCLVNFGGPNFHPIESAGILLWAFALPTLAAWCTYALVLWFTRSQAAG